MTISDGNAYEREITQVYPPVYPSQHTEALAAALAEALSLLEGYGARGATVRRLRQVLEDCGK